MLAVLWHCEHGQWQLSCDASSVVTLWAWPVTVVMLVFSLGFISQMVQMISHDHTPHLVSTRHLLFVFHCQYTSQSKFDLHCSEHRLFLSWSSSSGSCHVSHTSALTVPKGANNISWPHPSSWILLFSTRHLLLVFHCQYTSQSKFFRAQTVSKLK